MHEGALAEAFFLGVLITLGSTCPQYPKMAGLVPFIQIHKPGCSGFWWWLVSLFSKCGPLCTRENIMVAFRGVWTQAFWKAVTAEFLAMLIFVLLSLGSTINWGGTEKPLPVDMVLISLCFGLSIATMVQCFGHISGGHINPAVTVAMVCTRKISIAKSVFYIAAQCLGAIIGAGILYLVTPPSVVGGLGVTMVASLAIFKLGLQASCKLFAK